LASTFCIELREDGKRGNEVSVKFIFLLSTKKLVSKSHLVLLSLVHFIHFFVPLTSQFILIHCLSDIDRQANQA
jgi:hypothetical protein